MKTAFHAGVSGLVAYQQMLDTIGNNIANVNTAGYKHQTTAFSDLMYVHMNTKSAPELLKGVGVKASYTQLHADQSSFLNTGEKLDFAINGDGFFQVDNEGRREFTRNGAFTVGLRSNRMYLTTTDGAYVLDERGRRIEIKEKMVEKTTADISEDGTVNMSTAQVPQGYDFDSLKEQVGVFRFLNPHALGTVSSTRYLESEESGKAARDTKNVCTVVQGFLEQSGTNLADAMTDMIRAQRAYQVSSRVVSTADQIEEIVNNLRR